jgi:diguanylate cyclase (GGDEF)-like protein
LLSHHSTRTPTGVPAGSASTTQERRDSLGRGCRDRLGAWLEVHPRTLGELGTDRVHALTLLIDTARHAADRNVQLARQVEALQDAAEVLRNAAMIDPLTGVFNRRALMERLDIEIGRSLRYLRPLAVMMLDLDNFKHVNDAHGHATGDALLCAVAARIAAGVRAGDAFGRMGGDEFLVICPETTGAAAETVASKLIEAVAREKVEADGVTIAVGMSIGWVSVAPDLDAAEVMRLADEALYRAKSTGRGRAIEGG